MKKNIIFVLLCIFVMSFVLGYFVSSIEFGSEKTIGENHTDIINNELINEIIAYNEGLDYTQQVYDHCSSKENATEKFACVNAYVVENYNYKPVDEVYSIDEMFDNGADCKSYSIYYATLAKMMGYDYLFVQLPTHIFTIVYHDEGYCVLDEKVFTCFEYGEDVE